MTGGLWFGLSCLGVSLILPLDLPLDFQTRISDQFTKNAIYRRVHAKICTPTSLETMRCCYLTYTSLGSEPKPILLRSH